MIRYHFDFGDGEGIRFELEEDVDTSPDDGGAEPPAWMRLERHRCPSCELPQGSRHTCPAAEAFAPLLQAFGGRVSFETVQLTAELHGVTMRGTLPTQRAVRSVAGLVLAQSGCPVMRKLRPMAHFHLPFGTLEHSAFRVLGIHLIAQVLRQRQGLEPDWELASLGTLAEDLHMVTHSLAQRIRHEAERDAAVNGVVMLDSLATTAVEASLEQDLDGLQPLFSAYLV